MQKQSSDITGIAMEGMSLATQDEVYSWMQATFGPPSTDTWFLDHDYDLRNLMFTREIATMFYLRWADIL